MSQHKAVTLLLFQVFITIAVIEIIVMFFIPASIERIQTWYWELLDASIVTLLSFPILHYYINKYQSEQSFKNYRIIIIIKLSMLIFLAEVVIMYSLTLLHHTLDSTVIIILNGIILATLVTIGMYTLVKQSLNKHRNKTLTRRYILFLELFIPGLITLSISCYFIYQSQYQKVIKNICHHESIELKFITDEFISQLRFPLENILLLSNISSLQQYIDGHTEEKNSVIHDYTQLSLIHKVYDQIRFIDPQGTEIIRVNYRGNQIFVTPDSLLQNKKHRYYFTKSKNLTKNHVYLSPLDLNIENKQIEYPLNPMIRFGTPVFNSENERTGVIILNYRAQVLLDILKQFTPLLSGSLYLINDKGYWLYGKEEKHRWGFLYSDRSKFTFASEYPEAWSELTQSPSGQFTKNKILYTYYSPISTFSEKTNSIIAHITNPDLSLKIVSIYPLKDIPQELITFRNNILLLYSILSILLIIFSILISQALYLKRYYEIQQRDSMIQLDMLNKELIDSNKELEQFAYAASHDLKSPLIGIKGVIQLIFTQVESFARNDINELLQLVIDRIERMESFLKDLLEYSHVGQSKTVLQSVDLQKLLTNLIDLLSLPSSIKVTLPNNLSTMYTHKVPLEQIFRNLISNAIKYGDKENLYITISAVESKELWTFTISDNGPGIDPKFHKSIFTMFSRASSDESIEGNGIGLALVKKLVERYNGEIYLQSEVGKGSDFTFTWLKHEEL